MTSPREMSRDELERAYLRACEDRDFFKTRVDELMRTIAWIHGLMRSKFPPREKVYLYGLNSEEKELEPEENGLYRIPRSRLADKFGLTESQVGDCGKVLKEKGVIEKKSEYRNDDKTGQLKKDNLVALGDLVKKNPRAIDFSVDKKWGGLREKKDKTCEHCGGTNIQKHVHTRFFCKDCGVQIDEDFDTKDVNSHTENNSLEENNFSDGII